MEHSLLPSSSTPRSKSGSESAIPRKRKQVKNACVNCQKACKKCDECRPCTRCVKYGLQDSCNDSVRKERKKGVKRGPYKRKTSLEPFPEHILAPAPPPSMGHLSYDAASSYPYSSSMSRRQNPQMYFQMPENADGSIHGYFSDEDLYFTRKRSTSDQNKLGVLANLCSAVLDHSRANSPAKLSAIDTSSNHSSFDQEALDVLSAPIKPRSRSISEDSYHHYLQTRSRNPTDTIGAYYGMKIYENSYSQILPSIPQHLSMPITPPRSTGEVPSHPQTPIKLYIDGANPNASSIKQIDSNAVVKSETDL